MTNFELNETTTILVTGATGSFGQAIVGRILSSFPKITRLVIYSRDELKQFEMQQKYPDSVYPGIRYFLGDIRDGSRLRRALDGIDVVIHAAALKHVSAAEYNPFEFIKTNVIGVNNLIEACLQSEVKRVIALSTDKASSPVNLYGATKLCGDKLFVAANNIRGKRDIVFSVVRYGNVEGSRGSVIPLFLKQRESKILSVTDPSMTRFSISLGEGVDAVLFALCHSVGGEIFVPKLPGYRLSTLVEAFGPECEIQEVGLRAGEKMHEEMIAASDAPNTYDIGNYYIIVPRDGAVKARHYYEKVFSFERVSEQFSYSSDRPEYFLSVDSLRERIEKLTVD